MGSVLRSLNPGRQKLVLQGNQLLTPNYAKELFLHKYVGSHSPRRCMNEQLENDFRLEEKVMKKHMKELNEGKRSLLSDGKRYILIEWLHEAIQVYALKRVTFWLSVAILDTFLNNTDRQLRGKRLQLVCCACFLAAVKQEETVFQTNSFGGLEQRFGIKLGRHSLEHLYSLLMTTELHVLNTVNFDVIFPSCVGFVNQFFSKLVLLEGMDRERRGCKDEQADARQLRTCLFLLDLSALDLRFHDCKPSERAATVVFLSILLRGVKEAQDDWWNHFESVTLVSLDQLTNLAARIIHLVTREAEMPSTMFEWYCRPEHRGVAKMCISRMKVLVKQKISVPTTASNLYPLRREDTKKNGGFSSEAQTQGASARSYDTTSEAHTFVSLLSLKKSAFEGPERKQEHEHEHDQRCSQQKRVVLEDQRMRGCAQFFLKRNQVYNGQRQNSGRDTPLACSEASHTIRKDVSECCYAPHDRKPEASGASHNCPQQLQQRQQEVPQQQQQQQHYPSSSCSGDNEDDLRSSRRNSSLLARGRNKTPFPCIHGKSTPSANDGSSHISSPSNPPECKSDVVAGVSSQEVNSSQNTHEREAGDATTTTTTRNVVHISAASKNIGDDDDDNDASLHSSRSGADDTQFFTCNDDSESRSSFSSLHSSKPSAYPGGIFPLLPQASGGTRVFAYRYAGHDEENNRSAPHQQKFKHQSKQEQHEGALLLKTVVPTLGSQLKQQHSPMNQTTMQGEASRIQNEPPPAGVWIRQRSSTSSSLPPSSSTTQAPLQVSKEETTVKSGGEEEAGMWIQQGESDRTSYSVKPCRARQCVKNRSIDSCGI